MDEIDERNQRDEYDGDDEQPRTNGARRIAVCCPDCATDANYFAAALARHFARVDPDSTSARRPVVLIDGQPGTGGLDVVLDLEHRAGARWAALRGAGGDVDGVRLLAALPERDGVRVLSHGRGAGARLDGDVVLATGRALEANSSWRVSTVRPDVLPARGDHDLLVVLVRGTVCGLAATQQLMDGLAGATPAALVALETSGAARLTLHEVLGEPVVSASPLRWQLARGCAQDVLDGRWPGEGERTMTRLVQDVAIFASTRGRSLAWV